MNYGTNAYQNKWSSIMVFFPPSWVTATNLLLGFLLVWRNLREIFNNTVILTSYMGMIHFCNHFLLNYFFNLGTKWLAFKVWTMHISWIVQWTRVALPQSQRYWPLFWTASYRQFLLHLLTLNRTMVVIRSSELVI